MSNQRSLPTLLRSARVAACLSAGAVLLLGVTACSKEEPAPTAAAPQPTPTEAPRTAEPAPEPERRAARQNTFEGLDLDDKVEFPQINQPSTKEVAGAVAQLAAAIANGDSRTLHPMLDQPNQVILDDLVASGQWNESTGSISTVRVCTLEESEERVSVGLGIENEDGAYLLGWTGERLGGGWLFSGIALDTPVLASSAAELDGGSLAAREIPEPGAIIDDTFDPTVNDPRRGDSKKRRGSRRSGGGGGRRGLR